MNPIEAIQNSAEALMIDLEEPRLGDRITRQDVYHVLGAKKQLPQHTKGKNRVLGAKKQSPQDTR